MADIDTLLIGAGPASLASALALAEVNGPESVMAIDPSGCWMGEWRRRFAAHRIEHLRSSIYHHPHPDPERFIELAGPDSFLMLDGYRLPRAEHFERFIDSIVQLDGVADRVVAGRVADVIDRGSTVSVELAGGEVVSAHRVIIAVDARSFPEPGIEGARPADSVDLAEERSAGRRILVLGGGLTAARLAVAACDSGAHVALASRRRISVRPFDILPGWMGPRFLAGFDAEPSWAERRRMVAEGRHGTMPGWARRAIAERPLIELHNGAEWTLARNGNEIEARFSDGSVGCFDEVWEAFGGRPDVGASPLLGRLLRRRPTQVLDGLPVLDEDLRWPNTSIHVSGALAALQLGPGSGNLHGHRRAARRIAASVTGRAIADDAA
jgi:hypothetical protein